MKNIKQLFLTLFAVLFLYFAHNGSIDNYAESYTEQGLNRTLVTFAVSRSLNGVISVAQGTEVAVSPAGIGLNFAPGQILDPINDLIERFSWVVLASGTSLGIQRLLLEITSSTGISWLLSILLLVTLITLWLPKALKDEYARSISILGKGVLLIVFLRFSIPLIAIVNEALYLNFSEQRYEQAQLSLNSSAITLQNINDGSSASSIPNENSGSEDTGFIGTVEAWLDRSDKSFDFEEQVEALKSEADNISQQVINMIVVFVMQTFILPLFFLWLLVRVARVSVSNFHL
jgi:hypothetical protein